MSESKHTSGPWLVNPLCAQVDDSTGVPICQLLWPSDERSERETMENAKLIMAAPDMLAALEAITSNPHIDLGDLVYQVRERECQGWEGDAVRQWSEAVTSVLEAIKKAKGVA